MIRECAVVRFRHRAAVVVLASSSMLVSLAAASQAATAKTPASGGRCAVAGVMAKSGTGQQLRCVKVGKALVWKIDRPAVPAPGSSPSPSTSVAATGQSPWRNVTSNLAGLSSECGNMTSVEARSDRDQLIAGVAAQGLWSSGDGGATWAQIGTGQGSTPISNRPSLVQFDPADPNIWWENGIYGQAGVYKTVDGGATFAPVGDIRYIDLLSIDFSDPARRTMVALTHEAVLPLLSQDGGATWKSIAAGIPASIGNARSALVLDANTFLVGSQKLGGGAGIFRTSDAGSTWTKVSATGIWGKPLRLKDGTLLWLIEEGGGLLKSVDQGRTWTTLVGSNVFSSSTEAASNLIQLPDGRLAAAGRDRIVVSADQGLSWVPVGSPLPFAPYGLTYSAARRSFYIWHWDCGPQVLKDAIMSMEYTAKGK